MPRSTWCAGKPLFQPYFSDATPTKEASSSRQRRCRGCAHASKRSRADSAHFQKQIKAKKQAEVEAIMATHTCNALRERARKSCTFERQKRLSFVRLTCRTRQVLQWFIVLFFSVSERRERGCAPPGARTCASDNKSESAQ